MANLQSLINNMTTFQMMTLAQKLGIPSAWNVTKEQLSEALKARPEFNIEVDTTSITTVLDGMLITQIMDLNRQLETQGLPKVCEEYYSLRAKPRLRLGLYGQEVEQISLTFHVSQKQDLVTYENVLVRYASSYNGIKFNNATQSLEIKFSVPNIRL